VKTIFNQQDNGSTFRQWNLGLSQAKGDYLWFAESDDYATPRCWRPSSIDWIGTPTLVSPCVSRGPSIRTVNRWETPGIMPGLSIVQPMTAGIFAPHLPRFAPLIKSLTYQIETSAPEGA
jgi:hypothetical protein